MPRDKLSLFIQQPYFLPWLGFFAKLASSSIYVTLDDAKHRRNHISRVSILGPRGEPIWIKIPVGANQNDTINEIHMPKDRSYVRKSLSIIANSYGKTTYFRDEFPFIEYLLNDVLVSCLPNTLSNVNIQLIKKLAEYLGISMPVIFQSSEFGIAQRDRTKRKIEIVQATGAGTIIIGDGSSQHIHDFKAIKHSGICVKCLNYYTNHPRYAQLQRQRNKQPFLKGLSIVDCLLNVGKEQTKNIIFDVKLKAFGRNGCI